jgi:predicted  nucleic acid-binding Zn-ribbon protein
MKNLWKIVLGFFGGILAILGMGASAQKKEEVKKLDKAIKVKETETKELEKQVTVLESKKKVNKKQVATLKRKVTTTKKQIVEAKKAVEFDDSDEALKYLKKFSK